jgi:putative ABC transport system permease protein
VTKLALFLIAAATPAVDRELVVGDTIERLEELRAERGATAARRWLWREAARVMLHAPRHHLAAGATSAPAASTQRDAIMSTLGQDVRYALRWLWRSPGFTAVAVLTLALGLGANTAMFAVVNAVLLKPLPFRDADRLMLVHLRAPDREAGLGIYHEVVWSYPKYRTFDSAQQVFDDTALFGSRDVALAGDGEPERLRGEVITERYFNVLGIVPVVGRGFSADEANRAGGTPIAIISHGLWTRRYGADPGILGRSLLVGGIRHQVVGVLPRGFQGLNGNADVWLPLGLTDGWALTEAQAHSYMLVASRKRGVPEPTAQAAVAVYGEQVDAAHRSDNPSTSWGASAASLYASRVDVDLKRAALVVFGAVGCVLLIACVNLTNLLVAGAIARHREVAIRVALGAGRGRIARQFGIEGLILAAVGAVAGLAVASVLLTVASVVLPDSDVFFRSAVTPGTPRISGAAGLTRIGAGMIGLDGATLAFTVGLTLLTAVLVSMLPAWQASSLRPAQTLKAAGGTSTSRGSRGFGSRGTLVAVEIALALVLLSGAGLMLKSASHLRSTRIGVDSAGVLTAGISLPRPSYSADATRAFYDQLLGRLRTIPGVDDVGLGNCAPVSGGCNSTSIWFPPREHSPADPSVGIFWASPNYFSVLHIPLLQGRSFNDHDRIGQPRVVLVNETAARTYWPNASAIGQKVAVGQGGFHQGAEVVGVVADVRYRAIESAAGPQVYVPIAQSNQVNMRIFIRSSLDTASLVPSITSAVRSLDANLPVVGVKTVDGYVGDAMWRTRVATWLLSAFAGLALLLTAIGVFGVMAQTVAQRTPEFGIRMALGAQRRDVLGLVLGRGAIVTAAGLAVGLASSLLLTRAIAALLYGVAPNDPSTLGAVALVLGVVSLAACYIPARRATRVDAIVALRNE